MTWHLLDLLADQEWAIALALMGAFGGSSPIMRKAMLIFMLETSVEAFIFRRSISLLVDLTALAAVGFVNRLAMENVDGK